jgi:hypothetical protein
MLHCKLTILELEKAHEALEPGNSDAHASDHGICLAAEVRQQSAFTMLSEICTPLVAGNG